MHNEQLNKIIALCLSIDKLASQAYLQLSKNTKGQLSAFWLTMSTEEDTHVQIWQRLLTLASEGMVPQIFEDAGKIEAELQAVKSKCGKLCSNIQSLSDEAGTFLLAFRLEFYILHPAFATLFHFVSLFDHQVETEEIYDRHIEKFIKAMNTYATSTPELELLGETLHRLWHDNRVLTVQSTTDELTMILNRRGFLNVLKPLSHIAQRSNVAVTVMLIDIDNFKHVNDAFGHATGDRVLKKVAQTLRENLRASDVLGRYGGEEFIVFISSATRETALKLAETLRQKVAQASLGKASVTISIGISHGMLDRKVDESVMRLINAADECLYEAKGQGKNRAILRER
jgi:diguanylate cyclase (GGDEF)-like protein